MKKIDRIQCPPGIYVSTYSPGDRKTRYRFHVSNDPVDYFKDYGIYTAVGLKEAETFAYGLRCGYEMEFYDKFKEGKCEKLRQIITSRGVATAGSLSS